MASWQEQTRHSERLHPPETAAGARRRAGARARGRAGGRRAAMVGPAWAEWQRTFRTRPTHPSSASKVRSNSSSTARTLSSSAYGTPHLPRAQGHSSSPSPRADRRAGGQDTTRACGRAKRKHMSAHRRKRAGNSRTSAAHSGSSTYSQETPASWSTLMHASACGRSRHEVTIAELRSSAAHGDRKGAYASVPGTTPGSHPAASVGPEPSTAATPAPPARPPRCRPLRRPSS